MVISSSSLRLVALAAGLSNALNDIKSFVVVKGSALASFTAQARPPAQLVAGDFDGDGVSDLVLVGSSSTVSLAFSKSNRTKATASLGSFTAVTQTIAGFNAGPGVVALSANQGISRDFSP